jgi:pseudouridine kinase
MAPRVICFGAAHVDIHARALRPIVDGTSNPVEASRTRGGVAGNVATWLASLGCETNLVTRLGRDVAGDGVIGELEALGIGLAGTSRSNATATASYTAALDPTGELHVGLADMAVYDEITPDQVDTALTRLGGADAWFVDANLPEPTIAHLSNIIPEATLFAADTVSLSKSPRLRPALARLDILITNVAEVSSLLPSSTPETAATALRTLGSDHVLIGRGADGVLYGEQRGITAHPSAIARVIDVTGAGDALAAGMLFGMLSGRTTDETLRIALAAAALAVESPTPVPTRIDQTSLFARASIRL